MPDFGWEGDVEEANDEEDDVEPEPEPAEESKPETPVDEPLSDEELEAAMAGDLDTDGGTGASADAEGDSDPELVDDTKDELLAGDVPESDGETEPDGYDPFADLAGSSMDPEQAMSREHRKRVLIWGPPSVGKTHASYTADEPIAILDTEGKAHDLADKFADTTFRIWQPTDYVETLQHMEEALEWLEAWHEGRDKLGTLVVDSMSIMWEWAKQHYVAEYYPMRDPEDVKLKSGIGSSGESDWKKIKEFHNEKFRKRMVQSPYHLVWTAMATEDFAEMMEKSMNTAPDKPAGEKENPYKVNYILHVREGPDGVPFGDLEKSGITQHTFAGLEWPTLPKVFDVIDDIKAAENDPSPVDPDDVTDYDVELIKGKPSRLRGVEDDDS